MGPPEMPPLPLGRPECHNFFSARPVSGFTANEKEGRWILLKHALSYAATKSSLFTRRNGQFIHPELVMSCVCVSDRDIGVRKTNVDPGYFVLLGKEREKRDNGNFFDFRLLSENASRPEEMEGTTFHADRVIPSEVSW